MGLCGREKSQLLMDSDCALFVPYSIYLKIINFLDKFTNIRILVAYTVSAKMLEISAKHLLDSMHQKLIN